MNYDPGFRLQKPYGFVDRLLDFVTYFVTEIEATLKTHHGILEGNVKKTSKASSVIAEIIGISTISGVAKLLKDPVDLCFLKYYKNKCYKYIDIVYSFKKYPAEGRELFIKIGIEVFQSFEYQFMKVTTDDGPREAMKRLAQDAAERFLNFAKDADESSSSSSVALPEKRLEAQNVVHGKSKKELLDKLPTDIGNIKVKSHSIRFLKQKKPGYEIKYVTDHSEEYWKTASLYEKAGIIKNHDGRFVFFKRKQSKCEKYLFRQPFNDEIWENEYDTKIEPTDIHIKYTQDSIYLDQLEVILRKINNDDGDFVQKRCLELLEEFVDVFQSIKDENKQNCEDVIDKLKDIKQYIQDELGRSINVNNLILDKLNITENSSKVVKKEITFGLFDPVKSFTGREKELKELHVALTEDQKTTIISQTASITGLGGIGKTELSVKYAKVYSDYYRNIVLINSEKTENIAKSFKSLATNLGIKMMDDVKKQEREIIDIVEDIYTYFDDEKTLIILDNVENYEDVKDLIFKRSSRCKTVYTLITSRRRDWDVGEKGDIVVIPLDVFTDKEAIAYININLGEENQDDVLKLIKELDRLPLALKQAIGYIQQRNKKNQKWSEEKMFTVADYLVFYNEKKAILLNDGHYKKDDVYNKTVAMTWQITLESIEKDPKLGKLALKIFDIIAYMSPDNINVEQLFWKLEKEIEILRNSVELLHDYSMINLNKGRVNVHRLVQEVARLNLRKEKREISILKEALELLKWSNFEDHAISVWEYSSVYRYLVLDFYNESVYGFKRNSPLHLWAGYRNECNTIGNLLNHPKFVEVNCKNAEDETPLFKAAENGHNKVVAFLLQKGAIFKNECKLTGKTPLLAAVANGHGEVVQILCKNKALADLKQWRLESLINVAVFNGHPKVVEILKPNDNDILLFHARFRKGMIKNRCEMRENAIRVAHNKDPKMLSSKLKPYRGSILHLASEIEDIKVIQLLINLNTDVNVCDDNNESPLYYAVHKGHLRVCKLLLENGANCQLVNNKGKTPLHSAMEKRNLDLCYVLLEHGANINTVDSAGKTMLHYAANTCDADKLKIFVKKGSDIHAKDKFGRSPLHYAAEACNSSAISFFVREGISVDVTDKHGITPFTFVLNMNNNNLNIIKLLIELGATVPDTLNGNGKTPLHLAAENGNEDLCRLLLDKEANIKAVDNTGKTVLHYAANKCDVNTLKILIQKGLDIHAKDNLGRSVLHYAVEGNNCSAILFLVKKGIDVDLKDKSGCTPLNFISNGLNLYVDSIKLLIDLGANNNTFDNFGLTPLHKASSAYNLVNVIKVTDCASDGQSIRYVASKLNHLRIVELLLERGADQNLTDSDGQTPLHLAVENGDISVVNLLLRKGSDTKVVNNLRKTPLDIAVERQHKDIIYRLNQTDKSDDFDIDDRLWFDESSNNKYECG